MAGIMVFLGVYCIGLTSLHAQKITLKLGDYFPANSAPAIGIDRFAKLAEKYTNDEVKINIFHSYQLGPILTQIEGVRMGSQDMVTAPVTMLQQFGTAFQVSNLAYTFRNWDHYQKWCKSPLFKESIEAPLFDKGLRFIKQRFERRRFHYINFAVLYKLLESTEFLAIKIA